MSFSEEDEPIKIILLGNAGVGKTSIISRYDQNTFEENYKSTFSSHYIIKKLKVNKQTVILNVWDTAGQEKYHSLNKIFLKNSKIVILVYDVTIKKSFQDLSIWYDFIQNDLNENVILGLAGNKVDLLDEDGYQEEVSEDEAKIMAEKWDAEFALLSAKLDKKGIDDFFYKLVEKFINSDNLNNPEGKTKNVLLNENDLRDSQDKSGCC